MAHGRLKAWTVAMAVMGCGAGWADNVVLTSGDSISGTITQVGPETVDVTTTYAGPLKIQRNAVKTLRSDGKVNIVDPQGETHAAFVAPIEAGTAGWHESDAAVPPTGLSASVAPAPSPTTQPISAKAYYLDLEQYYLPIGPHWKNQFVLGITDTTGNTDSAALTAEANFAYKLKPQEFTLKMGVNYTNNDGTLASDQAYLDAIYRQTFPKWDKSERWYGFVENHELYDGIKGISLRSTTSFGPGYYFVKNDKLSVDGRVGPAFVYEKFFDGHNTTDIDGLAGLRAAYTINARTTLSEEVLYTQALSDQKRYQVTSDTNYAVKLPEIARGAGLKLEFRDDYDNAARAGNKRNDTRLILGLTLDF